MRSTEHRPTGAPRTPRRQALACLGGTLTAASLAFAVAAPAFAADALVYRCRGADQQITYTDTPCPNGDRVPMKPGNADPEAIRKLALVRADLDRSAAQRQASRAAEEARDKEIERMRRMMEERDESARRAALDTPAYYDYPYGGGWYLPYDGRGPAHAERSKRSHAHSDHSHRAPNSRPAPNPPFPVPRR